MQDLTSALKAPMSNGFGRKAQMPLVTAVATSGSRLALTTITGISRSSASLERSRRTP